LEAYLDEEGGAGDDMMLGSDPMTAALEQCGIDINDIMTAIMMGGLAGESKAPSDILSVLAEEGEQDCSAEQERQYEEAAATFVSCAGEKCGVMLEESSLLLGFRFHISRY
jgi:hypothetical protein